MQKMSYIIAALIALCSVACVDVNLGGLSSPADDVVAAVDDCVLTRSELQRDMPVGHIGEDSVIFARMYIDNWVLNQLKMRRAEELQAFSERDIERLVEGYRQSLIMRQLDQYYIDHAINPEISEREIASYYRANAAMFRLDHNKVRGVVVKTPRTFRNTSTLNTALRNVAKRGDGEEVAALAEKHSLQLVDMSNGWVSYSDFLSHLPTVRTRSYEDLLSKSGVQQMSSDEANFYFIITDVARKGATSPLECVEEDIRRMLYAQRRQQIVGDYEQELRREAVAAGRVTLSDTVLLRSMGYAPEPLVESDSIEVRGAEEIIEEELPAEDER